MQQTKSHEVTIALGDFNAKVRNLRDEDIKLKIAEKNERGNKIEFGKH